MKNSTSTTTVSLLAIAAIAVAFHSQEGASQLPPPPPAQSFNAHYSEIELTIGAGANDETMGQLYAHQSFQLPVSDRPVRISMTFTAADGELCVGEAVACEKASTGMRGFQIGGSQASWGGSVVFPIFEPFTGGEPRHAIILVDGALDGTEDSFQLKNAHTVGGKVRLGFWY